MGEATFSLLLLRATEGIANLLLKVPQTAWAFRRGGTAEPVKKSR
jgi:hypothetical protein